MKLHIKRLGYGFFYLYVPLFIIALLGYFIKIDEYIQVENKGGWIIYVLGFFSFIVTQYVLGYAVHNVTVIRKEKSNTF